MARHLHWSLSLLVTIVTWKTVQSQGLLCLECDKVASPEDCQTVIQCSPHEKCYAQRMIGSNLDEYFKLGCVDKDICGQLVYAAFGYNGEYDGTPPVVGKRHIHDKTDDVITTSDNDVVKSLQRAARSVYDMPICTQCCGKKFCNRGLCGARINNYVRHCFDCPDVIHPHDCQSTQVCNINDQCFVHRLRINLNETRYSLGCLPQRQCDGIVKAYNNLGCAKCCDDQLCNYFACDDWNTTTTPTPIAVPTRPSTLEIQGQNSVPFHNNVFLRCLEHGQNVSGTYTWTFNSSTQLPSNVINSNQQLFINHVDGRSQGVYGCTKLYPDGYRQQVSHTVMIEYAPPNVTVVQQPGGTTDNGDNVTLICRATGWPHPRVTWFVANAGLPHQPTTGVSYDHGHHNVHITNFQASEHAGVWECQAKNTNPDTGEQKMAAAAVTLS